MLLYSPRFISQTHLSSKFRSFFLRNFVNAINTSDSVKCIRNVAVVAHVDHGKTTLIDQFLRHTGGKIEKTRVMDSHELEIERGITILSKVTRLNWRNFVLNIIDTPGHSDFGGEVERILNVVDCVCLLVDVVEGPKLQTNFVLRKALENPSIRALVVVNKCDRECSKSQSEIENELFELFLDSNASDEQLNFPVIYASAKDSLASNSYPFTPSSTLPISHVLDAIIRTAPEPKTANFTHFTFQVTLIDVFEGSFLLTGKVYSGTIAAGTVLHVRDYLGNKRGTTVVKDIYVCVNGVRVKMVDKVLAGDIVTVQCYKGVVPQVNDTLSTIADFTALKPVKVSDPVISIVISANKSPFSGRDGKFITNSDIGKRLKREALTNLSVSIEESGDKSSFLVKGRGELQIGILLENMRREGYEMTVSPPTAIRFKVDGVEFEALQKLTCYVPSEHCTKIIDAINSRGIEAESMAEIGKGWVKIECEASTSQMMGLIPVLRDLSRAKGEFNTVTVGQCKFENRVYNKRNSGCLVSSNTGTTTAFGLEPAMAKGTLLVSEGMQVYEGMVIGESNSARDLHLNVTKSKPVTGMRSKGHEPSVKVVFRSLNIEQALAFIGSDEKLEITPKRLSIFKSK